MTACIANAVVNDEAVVTIQKKNEAWPRMSQDVGQSSALVASCGMWHLTLYGGGFLQQLSESRTRGLQFEQTH